MLSALTDYINDNFGSRRGVIRYCKYKLYILIGAFRRYQKVEFSGCQRFVFICSGNICRSALAEYLAKSVGLDSESFGLQCRGGDAADPRVIAYAKKLGIDMRPHITRNIKDYSYRKGDCLICMEPRHLKQLKYLGYDKQLTSACLWISPKSVYLHDPFASNSRYFDNCCNKLVKVVKRIKESV